ncbi:uncharacterized protein LOC132047458 [Lycium ferocissimum]|uniref:uncharacterized protein LOC132047458 n=1 Tax=Lycium ferocissimum TaxID=112874 RepID=UPI00281583E2|nr:uncharacterized protein LOC132047458 [Lycium ferocissimum]
MVGDVVLWLVDLMCLRLGLGVYLLGDSLEKVKLILERLFTDQSRQKSYEDQKARNLEFMIGEQVLLKVSPIKGVMRSEKKGKLSSRFISPFEIIQHILKWDSVLFDQNMTFEEEPVASFSRHVQMLRSKEMALVKVHWRHYLIEEAT